MTEYAIIAAIGFIAFILKGMIGTGTSTVIVALSALVIEPKLAVVLAAFVNIYGGLAMLRVDPVPIANRYWVAIAITMFIGSVIGAMALKVIDNDIFKVILGIAFLIVSAQFLLGNSNKKAGKSTAPNSANIKDLGVGTFAGFCGGFIGVNAPPLMFHFGRHLNKQNLRRLLTLIFIPAAIAQTVTFYFNGMLTTQVITYGIIIIPAMFLGIYLGNKAHNLVSEELFKRIIAIFLLFISIKLIIFG